MKWENGRRSANVEDRRGSGGRRAGIALGGGGAIVIALLAMFFGQDPNSFIGQLLGGLAGGQVQEQGQVATSPEEDRLAEMCSVVLADTEDTWNMLFEKMGKAYVEPKLVIFSGYVETGSGAADASTGPFYSPADRKVYIDLSFYEELAQRFKAPGDFAQAYVIAHEVGHHVQKLLGILDDAYAKMSVASEANKNRISVALELQADFFAGIWAHYADKSRGLLESGDLEEALGAAAAIGDDRIQKQAQGYVVPESFTHGTSAQRLKYFKLGYDSGDPSAYVAP